VSGAFATVNKSALRRKTLALLEIFRYGANPKALKSVAGSNLKPESFIRIREGLLRVDEMLGARRIFEVGAGLAPALWTLAFN